MPCYSQTIVCLVSTGGFACTLLPHPSRSIGTVSERLVEQFLSSPLQKVVEINFNLAAEGFWGKFLDATTHAARSSTNYLLEAAAIEEHPLPQDLGYPPADIRHSLIEPTYRCT